MKICRIIAFLLIAGLILNTVTFAKDNISARDFIPKWQKGTSWRLRSSLLATERVPLIRESRNALMTVLETPTRDMNRYVLRMVVGVDRECLFFLVDGSDLSLRQLRETNIRDLGKDERNYKITAWKESMLIREYPGGVPIVIDTDFVRMAFPVLRETVPSYEISNVFAISQESQFSKANDKTILTVLISKAKNAAIARQRLKANKPDYKLVWIKGQPWWSSYHLSSEDDYRLELVSQE